MNNGVDTGDAATPGSTGINIFVRSAVTGNIISGNSIKDDSYDVVINNGASVQVQFNNLWDTEFGVDNLGAGTVYATNNYWGCPLGPKAVGSCSSAEGSNVETKPWLKLPVPAPSRFPFRNIRPD
jgi:hypothetical protein